MKNSGPSSYPTVGCIRLIAKGGIRNLKRNLWAFPRKKAFDKKNRSSWQELVPEAEKVEDDSVHNSVGQGVLLIQQNPAQNHLLHQGSGLNTFAEDPDHRFSFYNVRSRSFEKLLKFD